MNQNLSILLKYVAGAALFGLWAALVFEGKADAQPLIVAIGAGISSLLGYHAITNLQATPKPVELAPLPVISPSGGPQ